MALSAMKIGPWGGSSGTPRDINRGSMPQYLRSITVRSSEEYGGRIYGFSFVYVDQKEQSISERTWGSKTKGEDQEPIDLSDDNYVNKISGTFDNYGVTSLNIVTTEGTEKKYGCPSGTAFSVPLLQNKVVGFFGRAGNSLVALGVYVPGEGRPGVKVGPWGGYSGMPLEIMDNFIPHRLMNITIRSSESPCGRIYGISFQYYSLCFQAITVGPWGSPTKGYANMIPLGPGEYVNHICGTFDNCGVTSLKIVTTTGAQHGPYGYPAGTTFSLPMQQGNATALSFFGRSDGNILIALGAYVGRRA